MIKKKEKFVCPNVSCSEKKLCESCDNKRIFRIIKIWGSVVVGLCLFVSSVIEYQDFYKMVLSSIKSFLVNGYYFLPSFIQTFLEVLLYGVPVAFLLTVFGFLLYMQIEDATNRF